ncbi:MAG: hypothetical protein GX621_06590 [Pirellulaceae bacterium]|nr:hypothetical protein [Pirellulaceae bacterium]
MRRGRLIATDRSGKRWFRSRRRTVPRGGHFRRLICETLEDRRLLSIMAISGSHVSTNFDPIVPMPLIRFEEATACLVEDFRSCTPALELYDNGVDGISGRLSMPGILYETISAEFSDFIRLQIPGWGTTDVIGQPELPVFRMSLPIPAGVNVIAGVTASESVNLVVTSRIYPVQAPRPGVEGWDESEEASIFDYDVDFYAESPESEAALFWISEPMTAGDRHSVAIEFYPFQYDTITGDISVVTDFEFDLQFHETALPEEAGGFGEDMASAAAGADYLIITADAFYDEVLPLAEWKQRKGYQTYIATMSEVGTTQTDIYNYIKAAYDADPDRPQYVLLVGDHENVPAWEIIGHPYYENPAYAWHTDYDYSLLAGSDKVADLAIGRLPGDTKSQIVTMVNKILTYECMPDTGDWYDDVLIAGLFQDDDNYDRIADRFFMETQHRIVDFLGGDYDFWPNPDPYDMGFTVHTTREWDSSTSNVLYYKTESYPGRITPPRPVPDAWKFKPDEGIAETINSGTSIVLHRDHGYNNGTGWANPSFTTGPVNSLVNGDKLPVVFSLNCATGWFDDKDAFGEAWLRNANGGAVAFTGAVRVSYSGYNDSLHVGIFDSMWNQYDQNWQSANFANSWHFGQLMNYAKDRVLAGYGYNSSKALLTARLFNVFGDPEMMIRTETPVALDVSHPTAVSVGAVMDFTVAVAKSGSPLPGAMVAISRSGSDDYWVGETDAAGQVTFAGLTTNEIGEYDVVVSERNAIPYQGTLLSTAISGIDLLGLDFNLDPDNLIRSLGLATAEFSVLNLSDAAVGSFDVQFYLSDDADIDPAVDILLQLSASDPHYDPAEPEAYHISGLDSLATLSDLVTLVVPAGDPFGTDNHYYVGMFVDADDDVAEVDETNNHARGLGRDLDDVHYTIVPVDHFVWETIASPRYAGVPIVVSVSAKDAAGETIVNFNDTANLAAWVGGNGMIYSSDFEDDNGGWLALAIGPLDGDWEWGVPTSGPGAAHSGQKAWATKLDGNCTGGYGGSYLIQQFDFTGCENVTLSWRQWVQTAAGAAGVYVNGSNCVYACDNYSTTPDYEEVVVDLSAYDNRDSVAIWFALSAMSAGGTPGWFIDDITITYDATPVAITPTVTGNFVNGVWTGEITVLEAAADVCLQIDAGAENATVSNAFDVLPDFIDDFGDAPMAAQSGLPGGYPTLLPDGARHLAVGPMLGVARDAEADGQPSPGAFGDDTNQTPNDEDGVDFLNSTIWASARMNNTTASVQVDLRNADAASNRLDAWIDLNRDGDWDDPGEKIFDNFDLGTSDGVQTLGFTIPRDTGDNIEPGDTYARFRISTAGGLAPTGPAADGEVEDHAIHLSTFEPPPGDVNLDNVVDQADAKVLAAHWGMSGVAWAEGDFNDDGVVNAADAAILAAHWGATVSPLPDDEPPKPVEPGVAGGAVLIGPLPARPAAGERRLIEPADRDRHEARILMGPLAKGSSSEQAAASDAVLADEYGPRPNEPLALGRRDPAWSFTLARRNLHQRDDRFVDKPALAVDLLMME